MKLFAVKLPLKYVHWQVMPEAIETQYILTLRSVYKELHADHETGAADNKTG